MAFGLPRNDSNRLTQVMTSPSPPPPFHHFQPDLCSIEKRMNSTLDWEPYEEKCITYISDSRAIEELHYLVQIESSSDRASPINFHACYLTTYFLASWRCRSCCNRWSTATATPSCAAPEQVHPRPAARSASRLRHIGNVD